MGKPLDPLEVAHERWQKVAGEVVAPGADKDAIWEAIVAPMVEKGLSPEDAVRGGIARLETLASASDERARRDAEVALLVEQSNTRAAKRITPPVEPKPREPSPRRSDVPDGEALLAEYEAGQTEEPPVSYRDLAERYGCDHKTVYNRIMTARQRREPPRPVRQASQETEAKITTTVIQALWQVEENCGGTGTEQGKDAVRRVLASAAIHLGLVPPDAVLAQSFGRNGQPSVSKDP